MSKLFKKKYWMIILVLLNYNLSYSQSQKNNTPDVEFLEGRIYIQINEISYYNPIKNGRRRVEQKQTSITSGFYGRISTHRVQLYQSKPTERLKCESYTSCPVFNGSSKFVLQRDPNTLKITESKEYPLQVSTKYLAQDFKWVKDQEKFVVTASTQASGINTLEGLNIEIKPFNPADNAEGVTLAPLVPSYVLWITGGRDWTLADEPKQDGTNLLWDDFKEQLMPVDEPLSLGIPYEINTPEIPERDGENVYQQLLWKDVKGFDAFLLNPYKAYSMSTMGSRYYKDDYSETKVSITVTISLGPVIELAPLENIDDFDLAPLEPLGEEIPLAPLDPVGIAPLDPVVPEGTLELTPIKK